MMDYKAPFVDLPAIAARFKKILARPEVKARVKKIAAAWNARIGIQDIRFVANAQQFMDREGIQHLREISGWVGEAVNHQQCVRLFLGKNKINNRNLAIYALFPNNPKDPRRDLHLHSELYIVEQEGIFINLPMLTMTVHNFAHEHIHFLQQRLDPEGVRSQGEKALDLPLVEHCLAPLEIDAYRAQIVIGRIWDDALREMGFRTRHYPRGLKRRRFYDMNPDLPLPLRQRRANLMSGIYLPRGMKSR